MTRIARLLCVLCVVGMSSSVFADMMVPIVDAEPLNDSMATATVLTDARIGDGAIGGMGTLMTSPGDVDFFRVDLLANDYFMVNTMPMAPAGSPVMTMVTLYDNAGSMIPGGMGMAGYIDTDFTPGTFYVGVTATGAAPYMMTFSANHLPEPATMSVLAIGGAIAMIRRRRRK